MAFVHVKDMTPEQRKRHEEIMTMLSPHTIAREQHRAILQADGEDEAIADQSYEDSQQQED